MGQFQVRFCWRSCFAFGLIAASGAGVALAESHPVDFAREIRPLLSKACIACHGPDDEHREAGLRLDVREDAMRELDSGSIALIPGDPVGSEMIARILSDDPDLQMPPPTSGHSLSAEQIDLIQRWVEQGAEYAGHWAYTPPRQAGLPEVQDLSWVRNPIDQFILAKLDAAGLTPSAEADRYTLARRLSLDLRGLPPTPEEVQAFIQDERPDAYEQLVERYLSDAAYGERMARKWLDLARYADSQGYAFDASRTIWRYRDWVVDAFNRNIPYTQFTIEQLAGDLLENATVEQRIATAFHRNTPVNVEAVAEESRVTIVRDRAETTMQVWMGLTLGCAKCHTHKFDPISITEYYQSYAFFNQAIDGSPEGLEVGVSSNDDPQIPAPTYEHLAIQRELDQQVAQAEAACNVPEEILAAEQADWERAMRVPLEWDVLDDVSIALEEDEPIEVLEDGSIFAGGQAPGLQRFSITRGQTRKDLSAIRLETIPDARLPAGSAGRAVDGSFILSRFSAEFAPAAPPEGDETPQPEPIEFSEARADYSQPGFAIENAIVKEDQKAKGYGGGWAVKPHLTDRHTADFIVKTPGDGTATSSLTIHLDHRYLIRQRVLGRFRLSITSTPEAAVQLVAPGDVAEIVRKPQAERTAAERVRVREYFRTIAPSLAPLQAQLAEINAQRPKIPTIPVMQDLPVEKQRTTAVMIKGNSENLGDEVDPAVPAAFHALPEGASANRLGLAQWLVSEENPLTARVAVNRLWSQIFGIGLVETEEDFGAQGDYPTHPELLDWLAVEFMRPGGGEQAWDLKHIVRLIVTSAVYRQSSLVDPARLEKDPRNQLYSRAPRFRLEAELVRDQALALSGLLSRKVGGPSVFPPQPDNVWQLAFSFERNWTTSPGEDRYRRGIYTYLRRSAPYPSMMTFDATSREICTVRRTRTNTPLQALVTLNDPVYVEAAQALGRRIVEEGGGNLRSRAEFALQLCLARPPLPEETSQLMRLFGETVAEFSQDETAATEMATDPLGPLPEDASAVEMAAWTVVSNVLLNLDGVLTKN